MAREVTNTRWMEVLYDAALHRMSTWLQGLQQRAAQKSLCSLPALMRLNDMCRALVHDRLQKQDLLQREARDDNSYTPETRVEHEAGYCT